MSDLDIDENLGRELVAVVDDLEVQGMIFDGDIDYETLEIIPKRSKKNRTWLDDYKDRMHESDRTNADYQGWE